MRGLALALFLGFSVAFGDESSVPTAFDLRNADGKGYVSSVKQQSGGTCWTHGTMAAIESNLMLSGVWSQNNEIGEPNLAEYHLDWWNGFNGHHNADIAPVSGGLTVHQGGDYRVAAAYLARAGGAVRDIDGQSYSVAPKNHSDAYHYYYVRDIHWFSAGSELENIEKIKKAIMQDGVIATALAWSDGFYSYSMNSFYQPTTSTMPANHAVAIVGWDDNKNTQASRPGAWLVKNSWGKTWGNAGFFWISYYDKVAGQHPQMGAISFKHVERMKYDRIYFHDYHGWRDTKNATEAFNAFVVQGNRGGRETLKAVSFYTTAENVQFTVGIFNRFEAGMLSEPLVVQAGRAENIGFHTVDLNRSVILNQGEPFYVYLKVSHGGQAFDKTSNVPVLLGGQGRPIVESRARPGESFYRSGTTWVDLTKEESTGNFCIKALVVLE